MIKAIVISNNKDCIKKINEAIKELNKNISSNNKTEIKPDEIGIVYIRGGVYTENEWNLSFEFADSDTVNILENETIHTTFSNLSFAIIPHESKIEYLESQKVLSNMLNDNTEIIIDATSSCKSQIGRAFTDYLISTAYKEKYQNINNHHLVKYKFTMPHTTSIPNIYKYLEDYIIKPEIKTEYKKTDDYTIKNALLKAIEYSMQQDINYSDDYFPGIDSYLHERFNINNDDLIKMGISLADEIPDVLKELEEKCIREFDDFEL